MSKSLKSLLALREKLKRGEISAAEYYAMPISERTLAEDAIDLLDDPALDRTVMAIYGAISRGLSKAEALSDCMM